jgi:hypothetical protein
MEPSREEIVASWRKLGAAMNELEQFVSLNLQHNHVYDPNSEDRIEWNNDLQAWVYNSPPSK